jgi:hypothetical protein
LNSSFYTKTATDSLLNTKVSTTALSSLIYKSGNKNYIVAGDSTQDQLVFQYKGTDIMDLDSGALTVYTNAIAPNVAQYYTINTGGTQQWVTLGQLTTIQEGKHFIIRTSYR